MTFFLSGFFPFFLSINIRRFFSLIFLSAIFCPFRRYDLVAVGAFASQGYFSAVIAYIAAFLGNVLGDMTSYVIWRHYGRAIIREKYAKKYRFFLKLESYTKRYAGPTVFASRFVGVLGPIVNFFAVMDECARGLPSR